MVPNNKTNKYLENYEYYCILIKHSYIFLTF